jgi:hypothetical protein
LAFFGNNVFDPMYAISPTLMMAAKEVAEVCVNGCRAGVEFDMMVERWKLVVYQRC